MDVGTVRGLLTLVLLLAFVGLVAWAWSARRRADFDEAARLPLDDEDRQAAGRTHHSAEGEPPNNHRADRS